MKKLTKLLMIFLVAAMIAGCFAACNQASNGEGNTTSESTTEKPTEATETESEATPDSSEITSEQVSEEISEDVSETTEVTTEVKSEVTTEAETKEFVDYAAEAKFNKNSGKIYAEVKVHTETHGDRTTYGFVDGDTTHFDVPEAVASAIGSDVLKARYLAVNTPESTGEIEPWGKMASNFTRAALEKATSIIIESDTSTWNADSTGGRYLVWVWYKTDDMADYRNLNIEILQAGLAFGSNTGGNTYGEIALNALNQAKEFKLYVFSKDKDPDFYYGGAYNVSLKELKTNTDVYSGKLVRFEGVVAKRSGVTLYMEEYDAETNMFFGIQVFCGYGVPGSIMKAMSVGNRISMVGTLQYYETGGYYQISNIQYDIMSPNSPEYVHKISDGHSAAYTEVDPDTILSGTVDIEVTKEDEEGNVSTETKTFTYGELAHFSTVTVKGLKVVSTYTTQSGDSMGAISVTCETQSGQRIIVRTEVLKDADGNTVKQDVFEIGSYIDVRGIIDFYQNAYQIKVFAITDVTFN